MTKTSTTPAAPSTHAPATKVRPTDVRTGSRWAGWGFILPFLAFYALFMLWPSLAMVGYSFTDRSLVGGEVSWVGLANWQEALGDDAMWRSLWVTVLFTVLSVPPLVILGAALAILTDHARRLGWFLRMAFFAPFVLPVAVMAMIWVWIYQPGFGLINQYLEMIGLPQVDWLGDEGTVLISIVIATVWWTVGFNFVLYLAALQGIPKETYEAAGIDGAGAWSKIWHITLPQLKRTTVLVAVLQVIASLRVFDQAYLMGGVHGGPNFASRTFIHYMYQSGFVDFRIGLASAMALVLFIGMVLVSVVLFYLITRDER
jgi:multiple sugar transport system permease protein